jgi:hypothetical protein
MHGQLSKRSKHIDEGLGVGDRGLARQGSFGTETRKFAFCDLERRGPDPGRGITDRVSTSDGLRERLGDGFACDVRTPRGKHERPPQAGLMVSERPFDAIDLDQWVHLSILLSPVVDRKGNSTGNP